MNEITLKEVSELTGVSENQVLKNYKQYSSKFEALGITKEGKGKKAKYYRIESQDPYQVAYEIFISIFRDAFDFNYKTNFDNLLLLMGYIKSHTLDKNHYFTARQFSYITGIREDTLSYYINQLREYKILKPKYVARKYYIAQVRDKSHEGEFFILETDITKIMQEEGIVDAWHGVNILDKYRTKYLMSEIHVQILRDIQKNLIYEIHKLEYTYSFLNDELLNEIIYNAYCYKLMNDNTFLTKTLELEKIQPFWEEVRSFD